MIDTIPVGGSPRGIAITPLIVAPDSDEDGVPDDEDLECRNKAAALLAAIPAARRMTAARRNAGTPA